MQPSTPPRRPCKSSSSCSRPKLTYRDALLSNMTSRVVASTGTQTPVNTDGCSTPNAAVVSPSQSSYATPRSDDTFITARSNGSYEVTLPAPQFVDESVTEPITRGVPLAAGNQEAVEIKSSQPVTVQRTAVVTTATMPIYLNDPVAFPCLSSLSTSTAGSSSLHRFNNSPRAGEPTPPDSPVKSTAFESKLCARTAQPLEQRDWWLDISSKFEILKNRSVHYLSAAGAITSPIEELLLLGHLRSLNVDGRQLYQNIIDTLEDCEDAEECDIKYHMEHNLCVLQENDKLWGDRINLLLTYIAAEGVMSTAKRKRMSRWDFQLGTGRDQMTMPRYGPRGRPKGRGRFSSNKWKSPDESSTLGLEQCRAGKAPEPSTSSACATEAKRAGDEDQRQAMFPQREREESPRESTSLDGRAATLPANHTLPTAQEDGTSLQKAPPKPDPSEALRQPRTSAKAPSPSPSPLISTYPTWADKVRKIRV